MKTFFVILLLVVAALLADQFMLWLERRGWLYYRKSKVKASTMVGSALHELQAQLQSDNVRHVIAAKTTKQSKSDRGAGSKDGSEKESSRDITDGRT